MAITNNHFNLQMGIDPFLRNIKYNSNTAVSQKQYLKMLASPNCLIKTPTKMQRRSKRLKKKAKVTNIQINMDQNQNTWMCKCCCQFDIEDIKLKCSQCNSDKTDSERNPDAQNKVIVEGYCRAVMHVPDEVME